MKTLYLECNMGAAGDMLMAALYELLNEEQRAQFLSVMNEIAPGDIAVSAEPSVKCGLNGTHMRVTVLGGEETGGDAPAPACEAAGESACGSVHAHDHGHHHYSAEELMERIGAMEVPENAKRRARQVYDRIAQAESEVHGIPVQEIHFHEVGSLDAVADVVGACLALELLAPDRVICSPVHVGFGEVRCAHGVLPVPAPATARILRGVPVYGGKIRGELCTPTGAALLRSFAGSFGAMPVMAVSQIGCGMGSKDFEAANCVRAFLGQEVSCSENAGTPAGGDEISELACNIDDMTGEELGFVMERLFDAGALDVCTTNIGMKKNRPGILLTCMCRTEDRERMVREIFRQTTTLGIREYRCERWRLDRSEYVRESEAGPVRIKRAEGYGACREKAEYEDLATIARREGISLREARRLAGE
ncbi:nickel pincer cofactor biosynthesis protein LarC [Lachnoclostridium sp. Marseille-P6806]|uniref:nickel pincer cofactor biosynthesis protein LarC n=1 Tax=Lachnoclostridium sp. Marseille-P6806 TaxID=2364793 RepID=UPI0010318AF7|nr:nickel pincer cofactor biosynthesis protein LarC [Lachnoclostridium sp. Marseille-P6806]